MTASEYINKLHEWVRDIGPEDEVKISPLRLTVAFNSKLGLELMDLIESLPDSEVKSKLIDIIYKGI